MSDWSPIHAAAYLVAGGDAPLIKNGRAQLQKLDRTHAHIIAVDGGGAALADAGVAPDCIMGDLDSLGSWAERGTFRNVPKVFLPDPNKSDLEKSILYLLARGVKNFTIYGGWGGTRMDHSIANLDLLAVYAPRARMTMIVGDTVMDGLSPENTAPGGLDFPARAGDLLSLLAAGQAATVTLRGTQYELAQAELQPGSHGVGNTATGDKIHIQIHSGCVRLIRML